MRPTAAVLLTLALAGCQTAPPADATPAAAGDGSDIQLGLRWDFAVSGAGAALKLFDAGNAPVLSIACVRGPAQMAVTVEQFTRVGSEERLTLGVDDEPFVLVADARADRAKGVEGLAPIHHDLLARLERANAVSANYGSQSIGPYMPPTPEQARSLTSACRQVLAAG